MTGPDDDLLLRREATDPDGRRYKVNAVVKDWNLGTGSVLLDAVQFVWALVRRARGKEWVVAVRLIESRPKPIVTRRASTREAALAIMDDVIEAIETGRDLDGEN